MPSRLRFVAAVALASTGLIVAGARVSASGPVGLYGIIERVVFEPREAGAERVQVWGAFAYVDGASTAAAGVSPVRRGYLYFRVPDDASLKPIVAREWADLKAVAGTGVAVAFGTWGYVGRFDGLDPSGSSGQLPYVLEMYPGRGVQTDLRVHPATRALAAPAVYQTNVGMVKLSPTGSRAEVVRRLQAALQIP
jgi:hypothetical protein